MAVVAEDTGAEGLATGRFLIGDTCVELDVEGRRFLLVWDADRVTWSADSGTVTFENHDGSQVALHDGLRTAMSGGNMSGAYGDAPAAWVAAVDWVSPPDPSCLADHAWWVNDVVEP